MSQPVFAPIANVHEALHAFHVTAHDRNAVTSAFHYCACLPPKATSQGYATPSRGMRQCLLYSGTASDAKLIGVEFLIEEADFLALDADEKKYWHSHQHEVESGMLCALGVGGVVCAAAGAVASVLPSAVNKGGGIPDALERPYLETIYKMYGKIFHFYDDPKTQSIPLGPPTLMMSTTDEHPSLVSASHPAHKLVAERDAELGLDTAAKAEVRAGWLPAFRERLDAAKDAQGTSTSVGAKIAPGADGWETSGRVPKLVVDEVAVTMER